MQSLRSRKGLIIASLFTCLAIDAQENNEGKIAETQAESAKTNINTPSPSTEPQTSNTESEATVKQEQNTQKSSTLGMEKAAGTIANGKFTSSRGFSIPIPQGYEVVSVAPGVSLMLKATSEISERFKPYISVTVKQGSTFIDKESATDNSAIINAEWIKNEYKKSLNDLTHEYEIISESIQEFPNKRKAMFIYTKFGVSNNQMMQSHFVYSNDKYTYLVTFTDLFQSFQRNFEAIYADLTLFNFEGETPERSSWLELGLKYGLPLLVLIALGLFFINRKSSQLESLNDSGDLTEASFSSDFDGASDQPLKEKSTKKTISEFGDDLENTSQVPKKVDDLEKILDEDSNVY